MFGVLAAFVLSKGLRRVESTLGELLRGDLALTVWLEVSLGSLVSSHDGVCMMNWLSLLMVGQLLGMVSWLVMLLVGGLFVMLFAMLRVLGSLLVVSGWLVVLALEVVILLDFVLSEGLDSGGVSLLGLAELLVVLLLSGNGFPAGDVVSVIVQGLLLGEGMESVAWEVVTGGAGAVVMSLEERSMSLSWSSSVSHVVGGVSSSSHVSHLLWLALGTVLSHGL